MSPKHSHFSSLWVVASRWVDGCEHEHEGKGNQWPGSMAKEAEVTNQGCSTKLTINVMTESRFEFRQLESNISPTMTSEKGNAYKPLNFRVRSYEARVRLNLTTDQFIMEI
jgi:hypothetical protein